MQSFNDFRNASESQKIEIIKTLPTDKVREFCGLRTNDEKHPSLYQWALATQSNELIQNLIPKMANYANELNKIIEARKLDQKRSSLDSNLSEKTTIGSLWFNKMMSSEIDHHMYAAGWHWIVHNQTAEGLKASLTLADQKEFNETMKQKKKTGTWQLTGWHLLHYNQTKTKKDKEAILALAHRESFNEAMVKQGCDNNTGWHAFFSYAKVGEKNQTLSLADRKSINEAMAKEDSSKNTGWHLAFRNMDKSPQALQEVKTILTLADRKSFNEAMTKQNFVEQTGWEHVISQLSGDGIREVLTVADQKLFNEGMRKRNCRNLNAWETLCTTASLETIRMIRNFSGKETFQVALADEQCSAISRGIEHRMDFDIFQYLLFEANPFNLSNFIWLVFERNQYYNHERNRALALFNNVTTCVRNPKQLMMNNADGFIEIASRFINSSPLLQAAQWFDVLSEAMNTKGISAKSLEQLQTLMLTVCVEGIRNDPDKMIVNAYTTIKTSTPELAEKWKEAISQALTLQNISAQTINLLRALQGRILLNQFYRTHDPKHYRQAFQQFIQISDVNHLPADDNKLVSEFLLDLSISIQQTNQIEQSASPRKAVSYNVALSVGSAPNLYAMIRKGLLHAQIFPSSTPPNLDIKEEKSIQSLTSTNTEQFVALISASIGVDVSDATGAAMGEEVNNAIQQLSKKSSQFDRLGWNELSKQIQKRVTDVQPGSEEEDFLVTICQLKIKCELAQLGSPIQNEFLKDMLDLLKEENRKIAKTGMFKSARGEWLTDTIQIVDDSSKSLKGLRQYQRYCENFRINLQQLEVAICKTLEKRQHPIEKQILAAIKRIKTLGNEIPFNANDKKNLKNAIKQEIKSVYSSIHAKLDENQDAVIEQRLKTYSNILTDDILIQKFQIDPHELEKTSKPEKHLKIM